MIGPMNWRKKFQQKRARGRRTTTARLFSEPLEPRLVLDGNVNVALVAGALTIDGDDLANTVIVSKGTAANEVLIKGANNTTINNTTGAFTTTDPITTVSVKLKKGDDNFTVQGNSFSDKLSIPAAFTIENYDGDKTNTFTNAAIASLSVKKNAGTNTSTLTIAGTNINGVTDINNRNGGDGPTVTTITSSDNITSPSQLATLKITNGDIGDDIITVDQANITADVSINNGKGNTRTFFGGGSQASPVVKGKIELTNDTGNDQFLLNKTAVWNLVKLDNGDGNTKTTLSNASAVGVGLGMAGNYIFTVNNKVGFDQFTMSNSKIKDGLQINNGFVLDTAGSSTTIDQASFVGGKFDFNGDGGFDTIRLGSGDTAHPVIFAREVDIKVNGGGSDVAFSAITIALSLKFNSDPAAIVTDTVLVSATTVTGDVEIKLGDGADKLTVRDASKFFGATTLDGGNGVGDQLEVQTSPTTGAVDLGVVSKTNFESETSLTS
jgi:hypothetical protein